MNREQAFKLATAITDGGYPCSVSLEPTGYSSVHLIGQRFTSVALEWLIGLAPAHGAELVLTDGGLRFLAGSREGMVG